MLTSKNQKKNKQQGHNLNHGRKTSVPLIKHKRHTISVCMIVKDEERFLEHCLKSVQDIADEIIIIDTGSQDNTVSIAKRYTGKVYFHPWNDSFSEARNHYFDYATGDWIFQIDADEELSKNDINDLRKAVKNPNVDALLVQIISHLEGKQFESRHNTVRLFRNNGIIHYEGRIHERLSGIKAPQISPVHLIHHGYDLNDKDLSEIKHQRRLSLLKIDVEDDPGNPLPYHYLSCCYLSNSLFKEALETSLKALELSEKKNDKDPIYLWTRYNAAMAYYKLKDFINAESIALSAIAMDSRHLDSYYLLTVIYFDQSKWHEVIKHANDYLHLSSKISKNPEDFGTIVINSLNESWKMLVLIGIAYFETNKHEESAKSFQSAISDPSNPLYALRTIGIYYYNKGLFPEAREYLLKAFDINSEDAMVNNLLAKTGTVQQNKQTISCCMIVKNEEQFLEKCLSSVKDYVDEIIIVDTGSTDNTVEIARRFTDKVYFQPWENSFSKARNQTLQYATCDWIFQIDGDEELMSGSGANLRMAVRDSKDCDIVYIQIHCSYENGTKKSFHNSGRLFRNNGKIHYEGSVHNQVVGSTKAFYSSIALWHYGYDVDEKKAKEKFERTVGLLLKEIEKDPENPMHHHNLSASYFSRQMNEEAINEAKKAIELSDSQKSPSNLYGWSHYIVSMGYYRMGRLEEAKQFAEKSLNKYPEHMDSNYMLTIIAFDEVRLDDVIRYGNAFLELLESIDNKKKNVILENSMNEGSIICTLIGHSYYYKNKLPEMEAYYKKAFDKADKKWLAWGRIGKYHMEKSHDLSLAEDYLNRAVDQAPKEKALWYMLAELNKRRCKINDELKCLEKVIGIGATEPFVYNRILELYMAKGMVDESMQIILNHTDKIDITGSMLCKIAVFQLEKGHVDSAIKYYTMALERDPDLFGAWASLGEIMLGTNMLEDSRTFFEKALSITENDISTIINLCDISSREGDVFSIVKYADLLLKALNLPHDRIINNLDELNTIIAEISSTLKENLYFQNQLSAISARISQLRHTPESTSRISY